MQKSVNKIALSLALIAFQNTNAAVVNVSRLYLPDNPNYVSPQALEEGADFDLDAALTNSRRSPSEFQKVTSSFSLKQYIKKHGLIDRVTFENPEARKRFEDILQKPDGGRLASEFQNDEIELLKNLSFEQIHAFEISNRDRICQHLGAERSVEMMQEEDPNTYTYTYNYYPNMNSINKLLELRKLEGGHKPLEFFRQQKASLLEKITTLHPEFSDQNMHWGGQENQRKTATERLDEFKEQLRPIAADPDHTAMIHFGLEPSFNNLETGQYLYPALPSHFDHWKSRLSPVGDYLLVNEYRDVMGPNHRMMHNINVYAILGANDYLKLLLRRVRGENPNQELLCEGDFEKMGDHLHASKKLEPTSLLTDPSCLNWHTYKKVLTLEKILEKLNTPMLTELADTLKCLAGSALGPEAVSIADKSLTPSGSSGASDNAPTTSSSHSAR